MTEHRKAVRLVAHRRDQCCPTCGQVLPPPRPQGLTLTPVQRHILELVQRAGSHGISSRAIVDTLYADDPDGGPEHALRCVYVQVVNLNHQLRPKGFEVRGNVPGQWGTYVYRRVSGGA